MVYVFFFDSNGDIIRDKDRLLRDDIEIKEI